MATPAPLDRILVDTGSVRAGSFWCRADDPWFADTGPIQHFLVYFPRHGVWIQHEGGRPFVADLQVATIYNRGQSYRRRAIADHDDRGDWYAVNEEVAHEMVAELDPASARSPARPFRFAWAPVDRTLFLRQRRLSHLLRTHPVSPLGAEEAILGLVARSIRSAYHGSGRGGVTSGTSVRQAALVSATKAVLLARSTENLSVSELATAVGASPWHLCRTFRRHTGLSLHEYRVQHRLRASMERVLSAGAPLSGIAADAGFASHAHYTSVFRREWNVTPSAMRRGHG